MFGIRRRGTCWFHQLNPMAIPLRPQGAEVFAGRLGRASVVHSILLLLLCATVPALPMESARTGSSDDCIACHQDRANAHIQDWEQSVHARSGMTCVGCHDRSRKSGGTVEMSSTGRTAACYSERQDVIRICERCHQDVGQAFRESLHYRNAGSGPATPTCIDCHSAAGGDILSGDLIPQRCATCHGENGAAGKTWVAEKAPDLLQLLRRVTLARTMVEEHLDLLDRIGGDVAAFRADLGRVDAGFRDIPFEWHRFNLTDVEDRSRQALRILESLHDLVELRLARSKPDLPPSESPPAVAPAPPQGNSLRVAVASMVDPIATYEAYLGLFGDLGQALGRPYQFVQRRTYHEVNELLLRGELDLAFICSGAYAAFPSDAPIEIVALPVVNGRSIYHSLIVVRTSSPAQRFEDLEGARFAFTDPLSNTGYLYPIFRLAKLGKDAQSFFASTLFSGSHDQSILAVYRKLVDAAAVDDLVFKNLVVPRSPYWDQLRVIESSPDFAIPPVVAPLSVPAELRARMRKFFLDMALTPHGRERLAALGFDGFTAAGKESYASIREMLDVAKSR
jgi:phosphonate transport system substrate-binding protein